MKDQQSLFSECRGMENHSRVADCTRLKRPLIREDLNVLQTSVLVG